MKEKLYFPILKGKLGEFQAIKDLNPSVKSQIAPVLEIIDVPWNFQNETYGTSPDEHLDGFLEKVSSALEGLSFYVDLPESLWEEELDGGLHPMAKVFSGIREKGLSGMPVTGPDRPTEYQDVIRSIVDTDKKGLCFRLPPDRLNPEHINGLLSIFSVDPSEIDLLIDFGEINQSPDIYAMAFQGAFGSLPHKDNWRNVIFTATAFPKDLTGIKAGMGSIPRAEWATWNKIRQVAETSKVKFGDYGISHPELVAMDPRVISMSAAIRYTTEKEWAIFKGKGVKLHGFNQFIELSQSLIASSAYMGPEFSVGDKLIKEYADKKLGEGKTGNATTWRKVGVNHHLTLVHHQLSNPS